MSDLHFIRITLATELRTDWRVTRIEATRPVRKLFKMILEGEKSLAWTGVGSSDGSKGWLDSECIMKAEPELPNRFLWTRMNWIELLAFRDIRVYKKHIFSFSILVISKKDNRCSKNREIMGEANHLSLWLALKNMVAVKTQALTSHLLGWLLD